MNAWGFRLLVATVAEGLFLDRHIDTARAYNNEEDVGAAIRDSGVPREDIFVSELSSSRDGASSSQ